jgi:hypothetical protein
VSDRLAELVTSLERVPDADVRATVQELVAAVLDLHGEALTRVLEIVAASDGDAGAALRAIAADTTLRPVLELHGLVAQEPPAGTPVTLLPTRTVERCELCGGPAGEDHPHVIDAETRAGRAICC